MKQLLTYLKESAHDTLQPKNKDELQRIIIDRIRKEGPRCDLNDIDVSHITDMSYLFSAGNNKIFTNFNGDISQWNVSNVKDMKYIFAGCEKFNCDISKWNVSRVSNVMGMLKGCANFNIKYVSKWKVQDVKEMPCNLLWM